MKAYILLALLISLFELNEQSSFPIKGPEMYQEKSHDELQDLVREYLSKLNQDTEQFNREKKLKQSEPEDAPLVNHRRKTNPQEQSCVSRINSFESNRMIDSKTSIKNGAKFIQVEKLDLNSEYSLKDLQDSCVNLCCSTESCDTGLLSLMHGEHGYRCYLFECSGQCIFIKHKEYVVLRQVSPEQNIDTQIQTGHKDPLDTTCHKEYEFSCLKSKQCIPIYDVCDSIPHCDDKSDEINCGEKKTTKEMSSSTTKNAKQTRKKIDNNYDYDDYDQDLLRQQNEILEHLKELEVLKSNRFYHSKDFLDSFMKESQNIKTTKSTKKSTTTSTKTLNKQIFHDMDSGSHKDMSWSDRDVRLINFDNGKSSNAAQKSDNFQAIFILIIGCMLVVSFFVFIALSTKFLSKKLRIMSMLRSDKSKSNAQNVDVDGDYLINGLYL